MDFAQQAVTQWEALAQALQAMFKRGDIVGDFDHVIEGNAGHFVELE